MENNKTASPWGDCPALDRGPMSREHEKRFIKREQDFGQTVKNKTLMAADINNVQNRAK